MLVTFKTNSHADITTFGDVAEKFLKMMGHSGAVPGALMAADVKPALDSFKDKLALETPPPAKRDNDSDDDGEVPVSNATRAAPLIGLMEAAIASGDNVMWDH